jgi:tetratricopeptide (TPR) repeat protein
MLVRRSSVILFPIMAGLVGAILGALVGEGFGLVPFLPLPPRHPDGWSLPHHAPPTNAAPTFRFAMARDVLTESYPRHAPSYFVQRAEVDQRRILALADVPRLKGDIPEEFFRLRNELAVARFRLGQTDEATTLIRQTLHLQESLARPASEQFATRFNLASFLLWSALRNGLKDEQHWAALRESRSLLADLDAFRPPTSLGDAGWLANLAALLLAARDCPALLLTYDLVGHRLDADVNPTPRPPLDDREAWERELACIHSGASADPARWRAAVPLVGGDSGFTEAIPLAPLSRRVPFDEPLLALVAAWRLGDGPSPHLALAMGETLARLGQTRLAWAAFERAVELEATFWPDAAIRRQFVTHCRRRQQCLESVLTASQRTALHADFAETLTAGRRWQRDFAAYEEEHLAPGGTLRVAELLATFEREHPRPQLPGEDADQFVPRPIREAASPTPWPTMLFFAGTFAMAMALWVQPMPRPRRATEAASEAAANQVEPTFPANGVGVPAPNSETPPTSPWE